MCITTLAAYLKRLRNDPKFKVGNLRRAAEEFLELLRGCAHPRTLLGAEKRRHRRRSTHVLRVLSGTYWLSDAALRTSLIQHCRIQ
jgi:hypothetical protein